MRLPTTPKLTAAVIRGQRRMSTTVDDIWNLLPAYDHAKLQASV
jgi:hypothetical protein